MQNRESKNNFFNIQWFCVVSALISALLQKGISVVNNGALVFRNAGAVTVAVYLDIAVLYESSHGLEQNSESDCVHDNAEINSNTEDISQHAREYHAYADDYSQLQLFVVLFKL